MAHPFKGFRATKPVTRLIDANACTYEAFFIVYYGDEKKYFRFRKGINEFPPSQRKLQADAMADVLWEALQKGWNPLQQKYPTFMEQVKAAVLSFDQSLDFALKIKKGQLSKFSCYDYEGCTRFMKQAAKETGISHTDITRIDRKDIRLLVATAKETREWSNNARNKYLTILKSLLSVLVDEDMLKYNPAHNIKNEQVNEGPGFARATDKEKEDIAGYLMLHYPDFFEYLMFIYQSGVRRKEALYIEVRDVNLSQRKLNIRGEVAKTNRHRAIPLTDDLMEILLRREIWKCPSNWFIFSNNKFAPGPEKYHPNTPTTWWKAIVQDKMGINLKMYSLKHKGADDKITAGIDLDVLKTLYGHRSKQMTEIYAKAVKEQYAETIIAKSPGFAKVVQLKKKSG